MFVRSCSILTRLCYSESQEGEPALQEVSQGSSQHKSWYCCPSMKTVRPINVQELEERKATLLQPFSLSQKHNPDPPAEVSAATAATVLVALMSSQSNSFPSFPKPAACCRHSLYPTTYMNIVLIKDLEMDLIPDYITLLSLAQCIQSLFCIERIPLRVIRTAFWGA